MFQVASRGVNTSCRETVLQCLRRPTKTEHLGSRVVCRGTIDVIPSYYMERRKFSFTSDVKTSVMKL